MPMKAPLALDIEFGIDNVDRGAVLYAEKAATQSNLVA